MQPLIKFILALYVHDKNKTQPSVRNRVEKKFLVCKVNEVVFLKEARMWVDRFPVVAAFFFIIVLYAGTSSGQDGKTATTDNNANAEGGAATPATEESATGAPTTGTESESLAVSTVEQPSAQQQPSSPCAPVSCSGPCN